MPLRRGLLFGAEPVHSILLVELVDLDGGDGANLRVTAAELSLTVQNWMNMQAGGRWALARHLAKAENQLLLQVVGEVILCTEENDTALRD